MFTLTTHTASTLPVCKQYAAHGWCPQADECTESHDLTNILHSEKLKSVVLKNRKRRLKAKERRKKSKVIKSDLPEVSAEDIVNPFSHPDSMSAEGHTELETSTDVASHDLTTCKDVPKLADGHRAGVDAFMTGVCYCIMGAQLSSKKLSLQDMRNKVYLSGKTLPLHVTKGNFGKMSNLHMEKMKLLKAKAIL
ncbi:TOE1 [Bugula neritina]|uniref:TOE1 n=1 Tax=Bugula neritina TaxID=10212 RepID=A0A7J7K4T5_BUGNE|nr:TOE1 [Bugula neritina]